MSEINNPVRPPCLKCGSRNVAWILWGRPIRTDRLEEQLERHEVTLGTCFVSEKGEVWECNECHHCFGSHSILPRLKRIKGEDVPLYIAAQQETWLHPEKTGQSKMCGCYHCLSFFTPQYIKEWVDDVYVDPVPLCPYCHQDSVIGDAHGYPITEEFLKEMRDYCYDESEW